MVQIIQSQPTQRQSALELAAQQAVQGFGQAYQQGQQTQRQQALQALDTAIQLRGQGYDVAPQQVQQMYNQPQAGFGGIFDKRTAEFTAKQEAEKAKLEREALSQGVELDYKKAQAEALRAEAPLKAQERMLQLQKTKEDLALSPLARRKAEAEIKKLEAESSGPLADKRTDTSKKAAGFYERMTQAENAFKKLPADIGTGMFGIKPPERFMSEDRKLQEQAKRNFISANLRLESGATIGDEEYALEEAKYFPAPGDTQKVLDQKEEARKLAIENLKMQGGVVNEAPGQKAQPPAFDMSAVDAALAKRGVAIGN